MRFISIKFFFIVILIIPNFLQSEQNSFSIAERFYKEKNYENALINFIDFSQKNPYNPKRELADYLSGLCYYNLNRYIDLIPHFKKFLNRFAYSRFKYDILYRLSVAYYSLSLYDKTKENIFKIIDIYNKKKTIDKVEIYINSIYILSMIYEKESLYDMSLKWLKEVLRLTGENKLAYYAYYKIGEIYIKYKNNKTLGLKYLFKAAKQEDFKYLEQVRELIYESRWSYISINEGLADPAIADVIFDGETVWIGSWLTGIYRYNLTGKQVAHYTTEHGLVSNFVRDLLNVSGKLWIATFEGISSYNFISEKWESYHRINGIELAPVKRLYYFMGKIYFVTLGTGFGSIRIKDNNFNMFSQDTCGVDDYLVDCVVNKEYIFLASINNGLYVLDHNGRIKKNFTKKHGLLSNDIRAIQIYRNSLYILTAKGINILDLKSMRLKKDSNINSLFGNSYILGMKIFNNIAWFSSLGHGAYYYSLATGQKGKITILNGLSDGNVSCMSLINDYMWFGTLGNGISIAWVYDILMGKRIMKKNELE